MQKPKYAEVHQKPAVVFSEKKKKQVNWPSGHSVLLSVVYKYKYF